MPMPKPLSDLDDLSGLTLQQIAQLVEDQKLPPVERWKPSGRGQSNMRIARDGRWYHDGEPIRRAAMVRLFSRILRREPDGGYVLVTPVEMLDIEVEDAPFVAVELKAEGRGKERTLAFRLNTGEPIVAGPAHPIAVGGGPDEPRPTLLVRSGLEALIARPVYYELADLALDEAAEPAGLWSGGAFFRLDGAE